MIIIRILEQGGQVGNLYPLQVERDGKEGEEQVRHEKCETLLRKSKNKNYIVHTR